MCGENEDMEAAQSHRRGSPPRVRGKRIVTLYVSLLRRITPACAGKTARPFVLLPRGEDHPRVCGENALVPCAVSSDRGSPPRVRGKLGIRIARLFVVRITPACAGKT